MTEEDRLTACGDDIQDALKKYDCLITVPEIRIHDGELFPIVELRIHPRPKQIDPKDNVRTIEPSSDIADK